MATQLDLAAYLARTGGRIAPPTIEALTELYLAHVRTFPFDNIDVLLEQHPGIELGTIQEKFVGRGRGGYCFEHSTLFFAVLQALGYDVALRLGRVGNALAAPRTHLVIIATFEGHRYLLDPGFGLPPLGLVPMVDGAVLEDDLWQHQMRRVEEGPTGHAWQLWRRRSRGWVIEHTTDELPVRPVDVAQGHWWTSTGPTSYFRTTLSIARHALTQDGTPIQTSVSLDGVTQRRPGAVSVRRELDVDELPALAESLGAGLSADEANRLVDRVRALLADQS
ncbi:MAG: arylamine N-acetyltransferase [Ornithinimicrobium sp.]|nr:arylamine N-acetyltransferase [Ornithinimicrobium sp.]MDO5739714.1 arylamine N-acetyltransferase [Ornithinimicrobium sp.]